MQKIIEDFAKVYSDFIIEFRFINDKPDTIKPILKVKSKDCSLDFEDDFLIITYRNCPNHKTCVNIKNKRKSNT